MNQNLLITKLQKILNDKIISRHPFPGPGLAIRIPGVIDTQKIKLLQEIDYIYINFY